jgi:HTH-type transcriptional regulator/antitoxin HigA
MGGKMIAFVIEKDLLEGISAPRVITSDAQNERYISVLLEMECRGHSTAEEKSFMELLIVLVETYEEEEHPVRSASPVEVLRELMIANNLRQKDLARLLGSESVVSEVLSGKRELNKRQIKKLSKRFHVSLEVFF